MKFLCVMIVACTIIGCGWGNRGKQPKMGNYVKTVQSASVILPTAVQIEALFPICNHYITEYGFEPGPRLWNTDVYFGGRYWLSMTQMIGIDYASDKIVSTVGEPQFRLFELAQVNLLSDGRVHAKMRSENQRDLGLAEWNRIVAAKGDVSVININMSADTVPNFDQYVDAMLKPQIKIRLIPR